MKRVFFGILLFILSASLQAQELNKFNKNDLVQFSGVIVTSDSISPVPFVNIMIQGTHYGTIADYYGYFSFVAHKNDTILFSAVGRKKGKFIIPDTISGKRYSLVHVMDEDTIMLPQTVIYPWPSKEAFKEVFLTFDVPDDDYERARKNMNPDQIQVLASKMRNTGSLNYKQDMAIVQQKLYYNGQMQPLSILNPFAWAKFIKAWKEGKFKRKKPSLKD
jgi:hypothetical protein